MSDMSLILDALKKSEQSRPQMLESGWLSSGVARQPARVPAWGWALIALLLINVLILLAVVIGAKPAMQNTDSPPAAMSPSVVDTRAVDSEPLSVTARRTRTESSAPARAAANPTAVAKDTARQPAVTRLEPLSANLPSRDTLLSQGTAIPAANITLHVFDSQRNSRFILLDSQRLGEGDTSRSGLRVNAITADGVIFGFGNNNFKVSIQ